MTGVDDGDDLFRCQRPSWLVPPTAIGKDEAHLLLEILLGAELAIWAADSAENNYAIRLWNPGAERMYGFTREEAVGSSYIDLFVNPDERAKAIKEHERAIEVGEEFSWNFVADDIAKNRSVVTILGNAFRIWDQVNQRFIMAEIGLDSSHFHRLNQQISRAKELSLLYDDARHELTVLRGLKIVDSAVATLVSPDSDGLSNIVRAIREAVQVMLPGEPICRVWLIDDGETQRLAVGSDEFPGLPTVQEASLVQEVVEKLAQVEICTTSDSPALIDSRTGKVFYSVIASPLRFGAETVGVLIMFFNECQITERHRHILQHFSNHAAIALTMARLAGDLQRRRQEDTQRTKHAIIQSVLHTVGNESGQTKLAVDSLTEDLENSGYLDRKPQEKLDLIRSSANRLGQIMDELRRLGEEVNQPVRLRLIEAMRMVTRVVERDHYSTIDVSHDVDPTLMVEISEYLFREAFGNLVRNAVQAMNEADRGGDLRVSAKPIEGGWNDQSETMLRIDIEDSGPGIRPECREKIWEFGFTTRGEGHGYGLFHTRGLVTMLGGSVQLLNEASDLGGAHFRIVLPIASSLG